MCVFCSIVKNVIPSYCLYEDQYVMAILDISQVTKGHTLLLPKKHCSNFLDCDDEIIAHIACVAKKIGNQIMERTGAIGMNVVSNVNEIAGQSVPHFHIHLIPRYSKDDACSIIFHESDEQDMDELLTLLK